MDNPKVSDVAPPNCFLIAFNDQIKNFEEGGNVFETAYRLWSKLPGIERRQYIMLEEDRKAIVRILTTGTMPYNVDNAQSIIDNERMLTIARLQKSTMSATTVKDGGSKEQQTMPKQVETLNLTPTTGSGKRRKIQHANRNIEQPPRDYNEYLNSIDQVWHSRT